MVLLKILATRLEVFFLAFLDYSKAFDVVSHQLLLTEKNVTSRGVNK